MPMIFLILTSFSLHADLGDSFAKSYFQAKVDEVYKKALACSPQEYDKKTKTSVSDWIKIQPPLPAWQMLTEIETVANDSRKYARKIGGNDKILHCLAGCYIAQKLDYTSAVLVGWYKELQDASDCSSRTNFEKKDYEATIKGAKAAGSELGCKKVCSP